MHSRHVYHKPLEPFDTAWNLNKCFALSSSISVDFTVEKVGMATRPLTASDLYPAADDPTVIPSADFEEQV